LDNSTRPNPQRNRIAITLVWPIPDMGWPAGTVIEIHCDWTPPPPAWVAWRRPDDQEIRLAPAGLPPGPEWYVFGGLAPAKCGDQGGKP
jgi:hypothetical protein